MTLLLNSTWRCACGAEQTTDLTTYAVALRGLRDHQKTEACSTRRAGDGDRIHSKRPARESEQRKSFDKEPAPVLHGPPRPPAPRTRRAREGLPWLPGN